MMDMRGFFVFGWKWGCDVKRTDHVFSFLQGRILLWNECKRLLEKRGISLRDDELTAIIQEQVSAGRVKVVPAIRKSMWTGRLQCMRCLGSVAHFRESHCARCGELCMYCEQCLMLSKVRGCMSLLFFAVDKHPGTSYESLSPMRFKCSTTQKVAMDQMDAFVQSSSKACLLWAVTGAGKTEVLLPTVDRYLREGKKVLWVTPRKDVVLELAPRLREAFPRMSFCALYGGSPDAWLDGDLVLATAHQTWRYGACFDLAVVDEVDAFPLYGDPSLEQGIRRAMKPSGKQVFLTATPPKKWTFWPRNPVIMVPARHHGYPLPVPQLMKQKGIRCCLHQGRAIPALSAFLTQCMKKAGQAMIFVPRIEDIALVVDRLIAQYPDRAASIAGVYAEHPEREQLVYAFRQGEITILVTTTILERGVTVPRCHVLVLSAQHRVFSSAALIQIAGRVGRSADYQAGEVWFVAEEKTIGQLDAKKQIKWLNSKADKEGFLKKGAYNH